MNSTSVTVVLLVRSEQQVFIECESKGKDSGFKPLGPASWELLLRSVPAASVPDRGQ